MNNTKYSSYIQVHIFSEVSILLKLIGIKMKKNTLVDMVNQQVFGFRKPTAEIIKNKLIILRLCLRCSNPKCPSSIMCFSLWYYYTSKLPSFDFTNEKIQTNLIQPHQNTHFCSWLFLLITQNFTCMTMTPNYKTQTWNAPWKAILYEYNVQYIDFFFTIYQLQSKDYTIYAPKHFPDFNSCS